MALLILGEDIAHAGLVGALVRRTLLEVAAHQHATWFTEIVDPDNPRDTSLKWLGDLSLSPDLNGQAFGLRYTKTTTATQRGQHLTINGRPVKLRGIPGDKAFELREWRHALAWALASDFNEPLDAVIAAKDTDGTPSKLEGLRRAVALLRARGETRPILLAAPHQDAEAWFVLGFEPTNPAERLRLTALTQTLSFDPVLRPDRLTASPNAAATDAKRVLNQLLFDRNKSTPIKREHLGEALARCLPNRAHIRTSGARCGIAPFVEAIETQLAPALGLTPEAHR